MAVAGKYEALAPDDTSVRKKKTKKRGKIWI